MGDFKIFKKAGISDFLGFMFFFFIFVVLIIILSWFGFFNTNTEQTASSNFKNQDYVLTINNFLNQKIFPADLIFDNAYENYNLSFLDILSYELSTYDSTGESILNSRALINALSKFILISNFDLTYKNEKISFSSRAVGGKKCIPVVSGNGYFSFSVPIFYYNKTGGLVSENVVFSTISFSSFDKKVVPEKFRLCVVE